MQSEQKSDWDRAFALRPMRESSQCASEDSKAWGEGKCRETSLAGFVTLLTGGIIVLSPTLDRMEDREGQRVTCADSDSESCNASS